MTKKSDELKNDNNAQEKANSQNEDKRPVCGLIMPIADTDGYPTGHWKEVKKIITSVAEDAGFRTRLVSESEDVRVIQKTIVQNVFDDDIIICDVSSKNPNVMFELGLRFAFDKAAVIIKDDETGYSFDTSPVEHINYRKDLRFSSIEQFKKDLRSKLTATFEKSQEPNHSMYLQDFGKFVIKELHTKDVSPNEFILERLDELQESIQNIKINKANNSSNEITYARHTWANDKDFSLSALSKKFAESHDLMVMTPSEHAIKLKQYISGVYKENGIIPPSLSTLEKFANNTVMP
ncbi:hypothetical protein [Chryseobacterium soli]|uniref:hypothetical protein n=1 Tax=Chryseobacterium soli TaxID=445961 RepID=UPI00068C2F08|nr:hypothetical protein [Chryseobacterium soli]